MKGSFSHCCYWYHLAFVLYAGREAAGKPVSAAPSKGKLRSDSYIFDPMLYCMENPHEYGISIKL